MKTTSIRKVNFPNTVTARERLGQILDLLLCAAISAGIAVSLLFLFTLA